MQSFLYTPVHTRNYRLTDIMLNASLLIFIVSALAAILAIAGMTIITITCARTQSHSSTQSRLLRAMRLIAIAGGLAAVVSGVSVALLQGTG